MRVWTAVLAGCVAFALAQTPQRFRASFRACGGSQSGCSNGVLFYDHSNADNNLKQLRINWSVGSGGATAVTEVIKSIQVPGTTTYNRIRYLRCGSSCDAETYNDRALIELYDTSDTNEGTDSGVTVPSVGACTRYVTLPAPATSQSRAVRRKWVRDNKICRVEFVDGMTWDFTAQWNHAAPAAADFNVDLSTCPSPRCNTKADLLLIMDESGSIDANEAIQCRNFGTSLVDRFTFGVDGMYMAYEMFGYNVRSVQTWTGSQATIRNAISGTGFQGGWTCIGKALTFARTTMFPQRPSFRVSQQLTPVVLLVTDGEICCPSTANPSSFSCSSGVETVSSVAAAARQIEASPHFGIVLTAGVDGAQIGQLQQIATNLPGEETSFYVAQFNQMTSLLDRILNVFCTPLSGNPCGTDCRGFCTCGQQCVCPGDCNDPSRLCFNGDCGAAGVSPRQGCVYTAKTWQNDPSFTRCRVAGTCNSTTGRFSYTEPAPATLCNDNNACTTDTCDPALGCRYSTITCNPADPCVVPVCFETCPSTATYSGVSYTNCSTGGCNNLNRYALAGGCACSTVNVATDCPVRACFDRSCTNVPLLAGSLGPNVPETNLNAGDCLYTPTTKCDTGNACLVSQCVVATDTCSETTLRDCSDGRNCTLDLCDPVTGCSNPFKAPSDCNDFSNCTIDSYECNDTLADGRGCRHDLKCPFISVCTQPYCNEVTGECLAEGIDRQCQNELREGRCTVALCNDNPNVTDVPQGCYLRTVDAGPEDNCGVCGGTGGDCGGAVITPAAAGGIAAGILALIIIAAIVAAALLAAGGGGGAVAYYKKYQHKLGEAHDNPLFKENPNMAGENPLYAAKD